MENVYKKTQTNIFKSVLLILFGSLIIPLSAKIQTPNAPVPTTMQTFAVLLLGMSLGYKLATITVVVYLIEGMLGMPVFAKGGGIIYLTGPTSGYLFGFIFVKLHKRIANEWISLLLIAPSLWTLLEIFRGYFLTGFPWFSLGYMESGSLISSWAPIGGVFLVSMVMAIASSAILLTFLNKRVLGGLIIVILIISSYLLGTVNWTHKSNH